MSHLATQSCEACSANAAKLGESDIQTLSSELPDWQVKEIEGEKRVSRVFKFKDFGEALAFTQRVGELAEEADHHPMIMTEWGKARVDWWTHKIGGLHKNDFIMAAKTDKIFNA